MTAAGYPVPGSRTVVDSQVAPEAEAPDLSASTIARISSSVAASRSPATVRAYDSGWRRFEAWCAQEDHRSFPAHPATVAAYLVAADMRTAEGRRVYAAATLGKWLAAISDRHRRRGCTDPTRHELVRATIAGIRRDYAAAGDRPPARRAPLLTTDIMQMIDTARRSCGSWADEVLERRDTAILLTGFAGAFRRSELADLLWSDITLAPTDGIHIRLRHSKTDQLGRGSVRALPYADDHTRCPPCALVRWAEVAAAFDCGGRPAVIRLLDGPQSFDGHVCVELLPTATESAVFRAIRKNGIILPTRLSGASVHAVVRRRAARAGFTPDVVAQLGGHSLRAGFVTQAFRAGADAHAIMRQTGHSTPAAVEVYARERAPLTGNAVTVLGL